MTDTLHVKAFRLFDAALAEATGTHFELKDWEDEHLHGCEECQRVLAVFARQVRARPPFFTASNGEVNPENGLYKSLCCDLELFIRAGEVFPDCARHKKLPTVWKRIRGGGAVAREDEPD